MFKFILKQKVYLFLVLMIGMIASCSSDDDMVIGDITSPTGELTKTIPWDETEASISFTANSAWEASVAEVGTRAATSISCLKLTVPNGGAGDVKMPLFLSKNDNETYREAEVTIKCGEKSVTVTIHQEANPDAVKMMDASAISNSLVSTKND